jgi:alkylation response protein AidB-like acyl-CoA dehydrogenase
VLTVVPHVEPLPDEEGKPEGVPQIRPRTAGARASTCATQLFSATRGLDQLGLEGQDTDGVLVRDCRVPTTELPGREGEGFKMLMEQLRQERLCIAAFQNAQFKPVELGTEVEIGQSFFRQADRAPRSRRRRGTSDARQQQVPVQVPVPPQRRTNRCQSPALSACALAPPPQSPSNAASDFPGPRICVGLSVFS